MLANGLGRMLQREALKGDRFVDLFAGSAAVSHFIAERVPRPVFSLDLQAYSAILSLSVTGRTRRLDPSLLEGDWFRHVERRLARDPRMQEAQRFSRAHLRKRDVSDARQLCSSVRGGLVWHAYGGHYFAPAQAIALDLMLDCLPDARDERSVSHAVTLLTASRIASSPGHTAQPLQPTSDGLQYISSYWARDAVDVARRLMPELAARVALCKGRASVGDAVRHAPRLRATDVVFVDPPYSAVQYSRFYHVLEAMACRQLGAVSGVGRMPAKGKRPQSAFSRRGDAAKSLHSLLQSLSLVGCRVVLTFPAGLASNGLSGGAVLDASREYFHVRHRVIEGRFSTLGGNNTKRASRQPSSELVLLLTAN
jgi:adenine-specific DNA-methyltransferase